MLAKRITGPREIILPVDPAIDTSRFDFGEYHNSMFDRAHVPLLPDATPALWTISPLTVRQRRLAEAHERGTWRWIALHVRCGLIRIDGYQIVNEEGAPESIEQPDRKDRPDSGASASDEWLDRIDLPRSVLEQLAYAIAWISEPRPLP